MQCRPRRCTCPAGHERFLALQVHRCPAAAELCRSPLIRRPRSRLAGVFKPLSPPRSRSLRSPGDPLPPGERVCRSPRRRARSHGDGGRTDPLPRRERVDRRAEQDEPGEGSDTHRRRSFVGRDKGWVGKRDCGRTRSRPRAVSSTNRRGRQSVTHGTLTSASLQLPRPLRALPPSLLYPRPRRQVAC